MAPSEDDQKTEEQNGEIRLWSLEEEIKRNEKLQLDHINALKDFCLSLPKLEGASITDELLVALLYSGDYDLNRAQTYAKKHFETRSGTSNVFASRHLDNEDIQSALSVGYFCALPRRCPKGCKIILQALRKTDPSLFHYPSSAKVQFLTIDACIHEDPITPGYIFLYDMKDVSFGHMIRWGIFLTRRLLKYTQEGLPLKIRQMHFLNSNPLTHKIMRALKPMMSQELWDMIKFYTADELEQFWEVIPKECLPQEYGGHLPDLETLHERNTNWLRNMQPKIDISNI